MIRGLATGTRQRLAPLGVALCAVALYAHTLGMGFVSDDVNTILSNAALHSLGNLPELFTRGMWPAGSAAEYTYRPVFMTAMAVDYALWGEAPRGYHLVSTLMHAANAVLVLLIARRLLESELAAGVAALLFAVHPVHVETVVWISARCGLMSAFFALAAFLLYLRARATGGAGALAGSLGLFLLAAFSKEDVIVFPALIFCAELALFRWAGRRSLLVTGAYLAVAAGYFAARTAVLRVVPEGGAPLAERLLTAPGIVVEYLRLLLAPYGQKVFYDIPLKNDFWSVGVILPGLLLTGVAALWWWSRRRDRLAFFCLAWLFIGLALFSGVPFLPSPSLMAPRYLYLPAVGFCLLTGLLAARFLSPPAGPGRRRAGLVLAGVVGLLLVGMAWRQSLVWADDVVYRNAYVADAPRVPQGHNGQGANLFRTGDFAGAEAAFKRAIALAPDYFDAHFNLGMTYLAMHREADAAGRFRRVLELNPRFPDALDQLGLLSLRQGRYDEALGYFGRALQIDRDNPRYQQNYRAAMQLKGGQ